MKKVLVFLFMSIGNTSRNIVEQQDYVYLGGETIGIVMDGEVSVNRMYEVNGKKPWVGTYLEEGSIIESINDTKVSKLSDIRSHVSNSNGNNITVKYKTNDLDYQASIKPVKVNNSYSIGIDVKDCLEGVGTLTYVDQNNNYGALGHIVKTSLTNGRLMSSEVRRIKRSEPGSPGYKNASLGKDMFGTITANNFTGIYGKLETLDVLTRQEKVKVGNKDDVQVGNAEIYTVLQGNTVTKHSIKINSVQKQESSDIKSISIEVTDKDLIEKTGGIVQGMSGSPIVQNGKIVGAVTHVIIDNPTTGYGIYIDWMLKNH